MGITIDLFESVATITIDRPEKLNSLSLKMYEDLGNAFSEVNKNNEVKAVVLTGAGERAFCVGADLTESIPALADDRFNISAWDPAHLKGVAFFKPIISAINGMCIGGGFEIILGTDIRIASKEAFFQFPEVNLGFVPAGGTLVRLVRQIGYAHAMEILLTARRFSSNDLLDRGIINEVVSQEEVLQRAQSIAVEIAGFSSNAVQTIKEAAITLQDYPLNEAFDKEAVLGQRTFTSEEAKVNLRKFAQRSKNKK